MCGVRCGKVYLWGGCIHEGVCGGVDWDYMVWSGDVYHQNRTVCVALLGSMVWI